MTAPIYHDAAGKLKMTPTKNTHPKVNDTDSNPEEADHDDHQERSCTPATLEFFYKKHYEIVWRILMKKFRNAQFVEDQIQNATIEVLRRITTIKEKALFSYFLRAALNNCLRFLERDRLRKALPLDFELCIPVKYDFDLVNADPFELLQEFEGELSKTERRVFFVMLKEWLDPNSKRPSDAEIAVVLCLSEGTITNIRSKVNIKLRTFLKARLKATHR